MKPIAARWVEANQRFLSASIEALRALLEGRAPPGPSPEELAAKMSPEPALDRVARIFELSPFERNVLLLAAGVELSSSFAETCASLQGDPARRAASFSLALAALGAPHWSALSPAAPLRRWKLIELPLGLGITSAPIRIDERILNALIGVDHLDERLSRLLEPLSRGESEVSLVPSHRAVAKELRAAWSRSPWPIVQVAGPGIADKAAIIAQVAAELGVSAFRLPALLAPATPSDLDTVLQLWNREALLEGRLLVIQGETTDAADAGRAASLAHLAERVRGPVVITTAEGRPIVERLGRLIFVGKPSAAEQAELWRQNLGSRAPAMNGKVEEIVDHFNLQAEEIRAAARVDFSAGDSPGALWDSCRVRSRPQLDALAQRIEPSAGWKDLILPEHDHLVLRDIALHVRRRRKVYEEWNFAGKGSRGLGITALFVGGSGTGKTLAAEVLARDLALDLYRIDLAQVVNKYIGETEKNLSRVFDAAESGGAVLLFDEADALFGKRSEVRDSHDRYANLEVSYLLQRMEAYRGLAILTTNMKDALDTAFMRRIRFLVKFPFPDAVQRAAIWRGIFPAETPVENLDFERLGRLSITGGSIRNIAVHAAFLAADAAQPVRMAHLGQAARAELSKLERPLHEAEIGGWQ